MPVSRAAVLEAANGAWRVSSAEVPEVAPGGLIMRQELCGICGTDAHIAHGHLPYVNFPVVMGHECVGVVEELGAGKHEDATGRPLAVGDRVYLVPGIRCGNCYFCVVLHEPTLCPNSKAYGFAQFKDKPLEVQGGYAEYLWLDPSVSVLKVEADAEQAVALEPLTIGLHAAMAMPTRINPGDTVVVQGAGAIGLMALVAAREYGADHVMVVGAPASRLALAREYGAAETLDLGEVRDPAERVRRVQAFSRTRLGADVVFECTGFPAAVREGIDMLRRGGTYVVAGHFTDAGEVPINPWAHLTRKHITLRGVWASDRAHFIRGRAILESGRYDFRKLISHRLPLSRVGEGIQALGGAYTLDGREVIKIVIEASQP